MTEIAEAEKVSKSYVSRILRLALLAPDIVEAIFSGWEQQRASLASAPDAIGTASYRSRLTGAAPQAGAHAETGRGATGRN